MAPRVVLGLTSETTRMKSALEYDQEMQPERLDGLSPCVALLEEFLFVASRVVFEEVENRSPISRYR